MLETCETCGTRYAPDLEACPQCGRKAEEMPKIIAGAGPSYPEGHAPGDGEEHVHPGTGVPMEGTEHPADGTPAEIAGEGDGPAGEEVEQLPPGEAASPAAEPDRRPVAPPRRTPPPVPGE